MKGIELTEEHKSKLLEMCKVLFPEYKYWNLHDGTCDLCMEGTLDFHKDEKPDWNSWNRVHWFEFVFTNLVNKIQNSLPEELIWRKQPEYVKNVFSWEKSNKWTMYNEFHFKYPKNIYKKNPIDYLYTEFKKIK